MLQAKKKEINIYEYWQIFLRRKYFFIIPFVGCMISCIIWNLTANSVYESSTVVQISQGRLLTPKMTNLVPGTVEPAGLDNLRNLITSYNYLMRLIKTLNLGNDPEMQPKAMKEKDKYPGLTLEEVTESLWLDNLRRHIDIKPYGTSFILISVQTNSPELAFNITQNLTNVFIDESLKRESGGIKGAIEFSSEQLALYKRRLQESEERLKQFKESIVQDQFEDNTIVSSNLDQINSMLTTVNLDLREAKDHLDLVESRINELGIFYYPPNSEELNRLKSRLLEATLELSTLMLKYSWDDPEVLRINLLIDDLREKIRDEIERNIKSQHFIEDGASLDLVVQKVTIPMDIEFLENKKVELNRLIKILKTSLAKGPGRELNMNRLEREVEVNREIYSTLLQQTQGSEIEKALQKTSAEFRFKIIEPATKPIKPIKPKRTRMIVMAVVFGFFLGVGTISLLEKSDQSFRNVEEVEKYLNLPVLGTMPHIEMGVGKKNLARVDSNK